MQPSLERALILALLADGQQASALARAETLWSQHPDDADACYVLGVARLTAGRAAEAIPVLKLALAQRPADHVAAGNLGIAQLRAGDATQACATLTTVVAAKPDYTAARYNLACAQIALGKGADAQKNLAPLLKGTPGNAVWLSAMADALRLQADWRRAIATYHKAIAADPQVLHAHLNLAPLLLHMGKSEEALEHARRAVELAPDSARAKQHLGDCLVARELFDDAMHAYADAYEITPDSAPLCVAIGKSWTNQGEFGEASTWFARALQLAPNDLDATCALADVALETNDVERALALLEPLAAAGAESAEYQQALSAAHWDDGDAEQAKAALQKAIALQPQRAALHAKLGHFLESSGDMAGARAAFRAALELNPDAIAALTGLAAADRGKLDEELVERIRKRLTAPRLQDGARASLNFALAYVEDGRKNAVAAAPHLREANRLQWASRSKRGWHYEAGEYERHVDNLIATFNKDFFAARQGFGNPDPTPVFIVGMPRSGTTLTEQILARHSQVLGIGERNFASRAFHAASRQLRRGHDDLPLREAFAGVNPRLLAALSRDYLETLHKLVAKSGKPGVRRVVDKMPDNYSQLGFIALLFPNARIIHCCRDPRDVAMSCFQTQFGAIRWACDPEHLVARFRQYARLMQHWQEHLPVPVYQSRYEELTADQESGSRNLIAWIGLDWEDACLSFYESDRLVRTASITQVRQPIYQTSVAKWKAYETLLPDLLAPLGEVADQLRTLHN